MKECATKAQRPLYLKAQKKTKKPTPMQEQTTQTKKRKKTGETRKPHPERHSEENKRPGGKTGRDKTGFATFPRRALAAPAKRPWGTEPNRTTEEARESGTRKQGYAERGRK